MDTSEHSIPVKGNELTPFTKIDLYHKIRDTILQLSGVYSRLHVYSAPDIQRLIKAKMTAKRGGPADLKALFELEDMIAEIRLAFAEEISNQNPSPNTNQNPNQNQDHIP